MKLHWKIIIGMLLGVLWAIVSALFGWSSFTINWIAPLGDIFINLLKLIALPLVLFSVISGIIGIGNPSNLGKMGAKTLGMYLLTTVISVSLGLVLVNVLQPGKVIDNDTRLYNRVNYELWANETSTPIKDELCFSCKTEYAEIVNEVKEKRESEVVPEDVQAKLNNAQATKDAGPLQPLVDVVPQNVFSALSGGPMLQVIFFAIFFGIAALYVPKKHAETVANFINSMNEVFLRMIDFIMKLTPFFVFALMAGVIARMAGNDLSKMVEIFKGLTLYSVAVVLGLGLMIFVFYPLVLKLIVRKIGYFEFFQKMAPAQMLAFSTSSSAATLPVTIECVEENLKVDKKVSSFVLPIGATVNMDGTSLYQAVAAVFLAQMFMIDLTLGQQITIVLTATLASIGSAAVPSAGLVMLMIVLSSVGLNPAWIAIVLPVDRILDMCRTTVNVTGDATVAAVIASTEET